MQFICGDDNAHYGGSGSGAGERAAAVIYNFVQERTAGGEYLGNDALVDIAREVGKLPQNVVQYLTLPGITYTVAHEIWTAGKQSAVQLQQTINNNPELKNKIKRFTEKVIETGKDILSTATGPIISTSKLITWLPYIIVIGLALGAFYIFKNPVKGPGKVSVF